MIKNKKIKNFKELATTKNREVALSIVEAGLQEIDTTNVISIKLKIEGAELTINNHKYNLEDYSRIRILGFGKASCAAAIALEEKLKERLADGVVIGTDSGVCETIDYYEGSHPRPSQKNVGFSQKLVDVAKDCKEDDLVIVIVSGGGSALLCWPESECTQGEKLYQAFLESGGTIHELNTVRKHLSKLKGGGLAKIVHPAKVISLIFSDVPGHHPELVASGPTYRDSSTIHDAQAVIEKYNLGEYELEETPKEKVWFENVDNHVLVSNETALSAMEEKASKLGLKSEIVSSELYEFPDEIMKRLKLDSSGKNVLLAGGETKLIIDKPGGKGGRNQYLALVALKSMNPGEVFVSISSDGYDNSEVAGAIVDLDLKNKMAEEGMVIQRHLEHYDAFTPFSAINDGQIITGRTESNVSDLIIYLRNE